MMADAANNLVSQKVDAAVAEFLKAVEGGSPPDINSFVSQHKDIAAELREFLSDLRVIEEVAHPVATQASTRGEHGLTGPLTTSRVPKWKAPRLFGNFELVDEIARGGMGVVYKARQQTPSRTVALKMILAGQLASKADVDRFYAEAHAAASLDHPQIVPIFEVGEREGQHYFTMAFVEGESLGQRLLKGPLPATEAATFIREVSLAVEYAHQHGVVHRDLKPANILLDTDNRVRVTDFGLAKRLADDAGLTRTGELLGTPSFMSPEQVSGDPTKIGPTADVYSLGATLYALVTGRPPFQAASTVDTLKQVVDQEPVPPREFDANIPPEIETITLKCLEKSADDRYKSASDLANDLQRYLQDEPIEARPPSYIYRFRKFARRNTALLIAGSAIVAALLLGLVGTTWQAIRATRAESMTLVERDHARQSELLSKTEATIATAVNNFLNEDLLAQADPSKEPDRDIKLRNVLDRAATKIGSRFSNQPLVEAALRTTLGKTYQSLDEKAVAEIQLRRARELYRRELGEDNPQTLISSSALARLLMDRGYAEENPQTLEEARQLLEQTLDRQRRVLSEVHSDTLDTVWALATALDYQEHPAEGLTLFDQLLPLSLVRRTWSDESDRTLKWMNTEANMLRKVGQADEALEYYQKALDMSRRVLGNDHPETITLENNLAYSLVHTGRMNEALSHNIRVVDATRRVLGEEHRQTNEAVSLMQLTVRALASAPFGTLGVVGYEPGPPTDPEAPPRAVKLIQGISDAMPNSGGAWTALGLAQYQAGDWNLAIEAWEKSIEVRQSNARVDFFLLAMAHWQLGHRDQSRKYYQRAVQGMDGSTLRDAWYRGFQIDAAKLLDIAEPKPESILSTPTERPSKTGDVPARSSSRD
jgi:serine/threonine protein kinase